MTRPSQLDEVPNPAGQGTHVRGLAVDSCSSASTGQSGA